MFHRINELLDVKAEGNTRGTENKGRNSKTKDNSANPKKV